MGGNQSTPQAPGKQFSNFLTGTESVPLAKTGMAAYTVVKEITVK